MKHRPLVLLTASLALVAAVAGITLGVTTLLGVTFQGEGTQPAEGAHSSGERNKLAICIQTLGADLGVDSSPHAAAVEAAAKSRVEVALALVATHPHWEPAGLAAFQPAVDIACPSLPPEPVRPVPPLIASIGGYEVSEPSPYGTFVFILPPEQLDHLLEGPVGPSSLRRAPQEVICDKSHYQCSEVTTALYLSEEELDDSVFLSRTLEEALGLGERP